MILGVIAESKIKNGICHICGTYTHLTYEHIPPRKAFNNRKVVVYEFHKAFSSEPDDEIKGKQLQKGLGGYTLCSSCNNKIGHWYGNDYVKFCYQGMQFLLKTRGQTLLHYPYHIFPLRIIKQIMGMFCSVNPPNFAKNHPDVVHFILNKNDLHLNPKFKIYIYYNKGNKFKKVGLAAIISPKIQVVSEFSYRPFGYLLTIDSDSPNHRLLDISFFADFRYNDSKSMLLKLPVL